MNIKILICVLIATTIVACSEVQNSGGKALENAGSVVKTGDQKLWGKETPGMEQTPEALQRY